MTAADRAAAAQPLWALVAAARPGALPAPGGDGGARRARRRSPTCSPPRPGSRAARRCSPSCCRRSAACTGSPPTGPDALADRRLGPVPALRAGRRSTLVQAPLGVVGDPRARRRGVGRPAARGRRRAARRQRGAARARRAARRGRHARRVRPRRAARGAARRSSSADELAGAAHVVDARPARRRKGTMLVLDGAPLDRAVTGALWAAFAGGGRRHAGVGRVIAVRPQAARARRRDRGRRAAAARRRPAPAGHRGRPARERGRPRPRRGARRRGGGGRRDRGCAAGRVDVAGVPGAFYAPGRAARGAAGRRAAARARPRPGARARRGGRRGRGDRARRRATSGTLSVWTGDRAHGERVARALGAEIAWINEHGVAVAGRAGPAGAATSPRASSRRSRRACARPAGCPTTRRCCAPRPRPRGCCTAASRSAGRRCAPARSRSRARRCGWRARRAVTLGWAGAVAGAGTGARRDRHRRRPRGGPPKPTSVLTATTTAAIPASSIRITPSSTSTGQDRGDERSDGGGLALEQELEVAHRALLGGGFLPT